MNVQLYPLLCSLFFSILSSALTTSFATASCFLKTISVITGIGATAKAFSPETRDLAQMHHSKVKKITIPEEQVLTRYKTVCIHAGLFPQGPVAQEPSSPSLDHLFAQFCPHGQFPDMGGEEIHNLLKYADDEYRWWVLESDYQATGQSKGLGYISANIDGEMVGHIFYYDGKVKNQVYVDYMAVLPTYKNKGIGTALHTFLYDYLKEQRPEIEQITLIATNEATKFHRRNGFGKGIPPLSVRKIARD